MGFRPAWPHAILLISGNAKKASVVVESSKKMQTTPPRCSSSAVKPMRHQGLNPITAGQDDLGRSPWFPKTTSPNKFW